jgi:hypothetical protein
VADVACGSGHILLAAARRIALRLSQARTQEDQPAPAPYRRALREVVQHCIYGVDKNPLAVELCKVALWLEAHNPGQPLNFLDHRIRCGDAIVGVGRAEDLDKGIPDEAFKTLPGDDKEVAARLRKVNAAARKGMEAIRKANQTELLQRLSALGADWKSLDTLEENTVQAVEAKRKQYESLRNGAQWWRLKQLADLVTAQFFIPKTPENELYLSTEKDFRDFSSGRKALQTQAVSKAVGVAGERRFFHWFLEFPEVMAQGGFDCVVGNPPYLGGTKISMFNGDNYFSYCKSNYYPASGRCDLIGYFVRRIFDVQRIRGFHSIITTNTISEGDTREGGFDLILQNSGIIVYAEKGLIWPGSANVIVTIYSMYKGKWKGPKILTKNLVDYISAYLTSDSFITKPHTLVKNSNCAFMGSSITGDGFIIDQITYNKIFQKNHKNKDIVYRYINGSDLNKIPYQIGEKLIINFFNSDLEVVQSNYPEALEIVESLVKPEREQKSLEVASAPWWKYWRIREDLYHSISKNDKILVLTRSTSTHGPIFIPKDNYVFSDAVVVYTSEEFANYSVIQSAFHEFWSWQFSSKLKNDRRYSISDAFETYPFPQKVIPSQAKQLEQIGEIYHEHRRQLMLGMQFGLTQTYNLFHARALPTPEQARGIAVLSPKEIEKQYGKETTHLVKHLATNQEATYSLEQALAGIHRLRALHVEMDQAVLEAYGWSDIALRHDFYEVDYLPENDRVRYTIHPEARREVLKRLLELNHKVYAEEVAQGLHEKGKGKKKGVDMVEEEMGDYSGEQGKLF